MAWGFFNDFEGFLDRESLLEEFLEDFKSYSSDSEVN